MSVRSVRRGLGASRWGPSSGRAATVAVMSGLVLLVAAGVAMWWRQTSPSVDAARATLDAGEVKPAPSDELVLEPAQAEPVRKSVMEEVKTQEVVPEEAMTPQDTVFDEEAFWAATLDRKMEKFLEDPGDLGNADKLLTRSIMALLSLEGRYTEELEGVPTPVQRGSEDETWVSSSGPFGRTALSSRSASKRASAGSRRCSRSCAPPPTARDRRSDPAARASTAAARACSRRCDRGCDVPAAR